MSNRLIAAGLGVSHHTVLAVRKELEDGGQIAHHDNRVGKDGVSQPARKPVAPTYSDPTQGGEKEALTAAKNIRAKKAAEKPGGMRLHRFVRKSFSLNKSWTKPVAEVGNRHQVTHQAPGTAFDVNTRLDLDAKGQHLRMEDVLLGECQFMQSATANYSKTKR